MDVTDQNTAQSAASQRRISPLAITIVLVIVLVLAFLGAASVTGEVLWFRQLGYLPVLVTQWIASGAMFLIGFLAMAIPVFLSIDIAYRKRPVYARLTAQLDRYQEVFEPLRKLVKWLLPAALGLFAGIAAASGWQNVLLWMNRTPVGEEDPQFGLDISFYLFDLPFWQGIVGFASAVVLVALIAGVATSYLYGGISISERNVRVSKATRIQAAVLAGIYLILQGVSLWLDQYRLLGDSRGLLTGAMFTDVHAVIPGKQILAGIAILVALLFLVTAFTGKWRLPVIGTALFLVASIVIGAGYPWAVQQFQVRPDEKGLEAEYIDRNIEATRAAYGLDKVQTESYEAVTTTKREALRDDAVATANIRIMDPAVISRTFKQLEGSQFYKFDDPLNVDRYLLDGEVEDTVSGVREIDASAQNGWFNQRLVYTHGYGLVAAYGNQRSPSGEPVFVESGIPTSGRLGEFEPRVYFSEGAPLYSIVGGEREKPIEFDFPADDAASSDAGDEAAEGDNAAPAGRQNLTTFSGDGGPTLDNIFTKLVYALKFQDMEVLLSGSIVEGSQILFDRNPVDRVQKVAPYLTIDGAPYASVIDGRIVWIIDGYTTSDAYPYSEVKDFNALTQDADTTGRPQLAKPVNYIRNSVKATVDAYDGSVKLYAWDAEDPLLQSWGKVFPGTLEPVSEMSGELLSHVRYPTDMFKVQRDVLSRYHMTDAGAFYSAEDAWRTPDDPVAKAAQTGGVTPKQPPYYLTLSAGKDSEPEFSIYSTYIPAAEGEGSREILRGYLAANSNAGTKDGEVSEDYGTLKLLTLPKGGNIPGPGQVQNSFNTDPKVSTELNILDQRGTKVISGNLLTLPVGGGLLYVQPVYIEASSGTSYPLLQKLLVSFGEEIAFEGTLDAALDKLFGGSSGASAGDGGTEVEDPGTAGEESTETNEESSGDLDALLKDMQQAIKDRDAAMKAGDWEAYGKADERLQEAVEAALKAQQ